MGVPQDKSRSRRLRPLLTLGFSLLAVTGAVVGVRAALRSPLFLVEVVEINPSDASMPVDLQELTDLAAIPEGKVNLFALDLKRVEARLLTSPWVREVTIQKRFPQTVSIGVTFRSPKALLQAESGALAYVDQDGKVFGKATLLVYPDLPVLSGFGQDSLSRTQRLQEALAVISHWPAGSAELSALSWDDERGLRALAAYGPTSKTLVDLGTDIGANGDVNLLTEHFERLSRVFEYLRKNSIAARQIWADAGKKIVVKTTRGS
jgi:cell division septal protein FtsQ